VIVIPALDLLGGKCVRMEQGDLASATVCADDPVAQAREFVAKGAPRLHVLDVDAAFGQGNNLAVIRAICEAVNVPVQVRGGLRTLDHAQARFDAGASEIVLGTMLVDDERTARAIIARFGHRVIAAVDARGRQVMTHGWRSSTPVDRDALVKRVAQWGVVRVISTEVRRSGMGEGFDIEALRAVAAAADVKITANGGARTIEHLRFLQQEAPPAVDSCIVGSALYKGTIDLAEAVAAVA
jgi:phosphoribosylformimino-5-aminoimidazole carboxamide ribotide isomerase